MLETKDHQNAAGDRLKEQLQGLPQHLKGLQIFTVGNKNRIIWLAFRLLWSKLLHFPHDTETLIRYSTLGYKCYGKKEQELTFRKWDLPPIYVPKSVALDSCLIPKCTYSYLWQKWIFTNSWLQVHCKTQCFAKLLFVKDMPPVKARSTHFAGGVTFSFPRL